MESVLSQEFSRPLKESKSDGDELLLFPSQKSKQNNHESSSENVFRKNLNDSSSPREQFKDNIDNNLQCDEEEEKKEDGHSASDIEEIKNDANNCEDNNNDDNTSNSSLNDEDFAFDSENESPKPDIKPNSEIITDSGKISEKIVENKDDIFLNTNVSTPNPTNSQESHLIGQNEMHEPKSTSLFSQFDKHIQISIPNSSATQPSLFSTPSQSQSIFQSVNRQNNQIKSSVNTSSLFSINEPKTVNDSALQQNNTNIADSNKTFGIKNAPKSKGKKFQIKKK